MFKKIIGIFVVLTMLFQCIAPINIIAINDEENAAQDEIDAETMTETSSENDSQEDLQESTENVFLENSAFFDTGESFLLEAESTLPKVYKTIYEDDFSTSDKLSSWWILRPYSGGTATAVDGKFKLKRTNNEAERTFGTVYFDSSTQDVTGGIVALQTTISKEGTGTAGFTICYNGYAVGSMLYWNANNTFTVTYRENPNGAITTATTQRAYTGEVKLTIAFNTMDGTYTYWAGEEIIFENIYGRGISNSIGSMRAELLEQNYITVYMDDLRLFYAYPNDSVVQKFDKQLLKDTDLLTSPYIEDNIINTDLRLPGEGTYGSTITWESSEPEIISHDGKITRPSAGVSEEVILTATITSPSGEKEYSDFTFRVSSTRPPEKAREYKSIYKDDFSTDENMSAWWLLRPFTGGTAYPYDGKFNLTRTTNVEERAYANVYFSDTKHDLDSGIVAFDVKLSKEGTGSGNLVFLYDSYSVGTMITWNRNNTFSITYRDTSSSVINTHTTTKAYTGEVAVEVIFNTMKGTYTYWLNDDLILENKFGRGVSNKLGSMRAELMETNYITMYMDDMHIYYAYPNDNETQLFDKQFITYESLITRPFISDKCINADLKLPQTGQYGSLITWESSNSEIISNEGKVTRPATGISDEVTLTATITSPSGEKEYSTFVFTVSSIKPAQKALLHKSIYSDDFSTADNMEKWWLLRPFTGGTAYPYDGKFNLTRTTNVEERAYANIYFDETRSNLESGVIAFDVTLSKKGTGSGNLVFLYNTSAIGTMITWNRNNTFSITYRDTPNSAIDTHTTTKAYTGEVAVEVIFNTMKGTYTYWLNDDLIMENKYGRGVSNSLGLVRAELMETNYITMYMDDLHVYYAYPPEAEIPLFDQKALTDKDLLTAPYLLKNIIDRDLALPQKGTYGSDITWESDMPDVIDTNGKIYPYVDAQTNPEVTLTATFSVPSGEWTEKEFKFTVSNKYSSDEKVVEADLNLLTFENYEMFSFDDDSLDAIRTFINIPSKLIYGSSVKWKSSDPFTVTNNGRVIRGRWDESPKDVTLTATVSRGNIVRTKEFNLTILPDEELKDPNYMSNEQFFGKWNGSSWETEGKFDYEAFPKMAEVEKAAKEGDYEKAKVELLNYMRTREKKNMITEAPTRNTVLVDNTVMNGIWSYTPTRTYYGKGTITSHDYQETRISILPEKIKRDVTLAVQATYNENSSINILSRENEDKKTWPRLEVVFSGKTRVYYPSADTMIRAGEYARNNYGGEKELTAMLKGEFQGDDTILPELKFNISIPEGETVDEATLIFTAKINEPNIESKDILILEEPNVSWVEDELTWANLTHTWYASEGLPGHMDWLSYPLYNDSEFHQAHRFPQFSPALAEYKYTNDEKYAYFIIYTMMDYVRDSQFPMSLNQLWGVHGQYYWLNFVEWDQKINPQGLEFDTIHYGGLPHPLSASIRMTAWRNVFEDLLYSKYMTPDVCTTILKDFFNTSSEGTKYIKDYEVPQALNRANNQAVIQTQSFTSTALFVPEFKEGEEWIDVAVELFENMSNGGFYEDGAYGESATAYSGLVLDLYIAFYNTFHKVGLESKLPEGFGDFIYKALIYNEVVERDSAGINMAWGDDQYAVNTGRKFPDYEKISDDPTYLFLDSFGKLGEAPSWTSKHYAGNMVTAMRSDWTSNALHAFTNCDGIGSGHGHQDSNQLRITAYGENLLTDPGVFSYNNDMYRVWGTSTRAHNTVEVDNVTQGTLNTGHTLLGSLNRWVTNNQFDVLSQTTKAYNMDESSPGVDHRRTITFLKSGFWVVNDLMIPNDSTTPHDYKQLWHMLPSLGKSMKFDYENGKVGSEQAGPNIIISSPDGNAIESEDGWYTIAWATYADAPYFYYKKDNAVGNATFNTVVFPYPEKGQGDVSTEKIDLGVADNIASAMKIKTNLVGDISETSFMIDYEANKGSLRTFGDYSGDGFINAVRKSKNGTTLEIILDNGTKIMRGEETLLSVSSDKAVSLGVEVVGKSVNISSDDESVKPEDVFVKLDTVVDNVRFNGTNIAFTQTDSGKLALTSEEVDEKLTNDPSGKGDGFDYPEKNNQGSTGGGGSGGSSGSGESGSSEGNNKNTTDIVFKDVVGHWAEEHIIKVSQKGIILGDENKNFRPDDNITRAEIVTMAVKLLKLDTQNDGITVFNDVSAGAWYAPFVKAALEKGIISKDNSFRPQDKLTREEMCKILSNIYSVYKKEEINIPSDFAVDFADKDSIAEWAKEFVNTAVYYGLMNGMGENMFAPKANATRAQVATVMAKILEK